MEGHGNGSLDVNVEGTVLLLHASIASRRVYVGISEGRSRC